jgi:hypothetical protein
MLKSTIQYDVDFLIIFLDANALSSKWVKQELDWALEREIVLSRTFVLPIVLDNSSGAFSTCFGDAITARSSGLHKPLRHRAGPTCFRTVVSSGHKESCGSREDECFSTDNL